jgi:hypothetical protein
MKPEELAKTEEDSVNSETQNSTAFDLEKELAGGLTLSYGHDPKEEYISAIKLISSKLVENGYLNSEVSSFNKNLEDAIKNFQKENSLNITSVIDNELYLKLVKNKDIIVQKSKSEKKLDQAASGEIYAVPKSEEKDYRLGVFYKGGVFTVNQDVEWAKIIDYRVKGGEIVEINAELKNGEKVTYTKDSPNDALRNSIIDLAKFKALKDDDFEEGTMTRNAIMGKSVTKTPEYSPQMTPSDGDFDVRSVSSRSGVSAAMIMAFIKGESQGNPGAKAFNGDNYCNCLGWKSSSKTEEFLSGLEAGNINGSSYINKKWTNKVRFAYKTSYESWKANYKSKGFSYKSGYRYYDTAYFNAHREGTDSQKAFDLAYSLSPECAVKATAWGMAQVMGTHLINTHNEIVKFNTGKEAREHFDSIAMYASSEMYVSWVKSAGRFPKNSSKYTSYAKKYGIPEVLGASYLDVINMAEDNPDKYGYFLFLTKRYYGGWDNVYAKRLQENFKYYKSIYGNKLASERYKSIIKRSNKLMKMGSSKERRKEFFKNISRSKK